jgi:hypothetical protein
MCARQAGAESDYKNSAMTVNAESGVGDRIERNILLTVRVVALAAN